MGRGSDGQHRKHAGFWRDREGQGKYIFSFDVASQWGQAIPLGNLRTRMVILWTKLIMYLGFQHCFAVYTSSFS